MFRPYGAINPNMFPIRRVKSSSWIWVFVAFVIVAVLAVIVYSLLDPTSPPSPPPVSPPPPSNTEKGFCVFKPTLANKDNFTIASTASNIPLFPNDLSPADYGEHFTYGIGHSLNTSALNCKKNGSGYVMFSPSGPTHLGYKYDTIGATISTELLPFDGTTTKTNDNCTWDPKSNTCDIPICNLDKLYNVDVSHPKHGVKQYLTESELQSFKTRISCKSGEKYGQCFSLSDSDGMNCNASVKQNNKINCLGNCSGHPDILTREDCENGGNEWNYNPELANNCSYNVLNNPLFKTDSVQLINGSYKMCNLPGDSVDLDSMFDTCSDACYPDPNNTPGNDDIHKIPLSWANKCGFTNISGKFTTSSPQETNCLNFYDGIIDYNICNADRDGDCQRLTQTASFNSSACEGGGNTFEIINTCEPMTCENVHSRTLNTGYDFQNCPAGQQPRTTIPGTPSPQPHMPPATTCDPTSTSNIMNYFNREYKQCCEDYTCSPGICNTDFYEALPPLTPDGSPPKCRGSGCNLSECCQLQTCGTFMDAGSNRQCNDGYKYEPTSRSNYFILPTCCNGVLQVIVTFKSTYNMQTIAQSIPTTQDTDPTNVYPSSILKMLLNNSNSIVINDPDIGINATTLNASMTNLSFINNETTIMDVPTTNLNLMESYLTKSNASQIQRLQNQLSQSFNFYIVIPQYGGTEKITRFNIQEAWEIINDKSKNIQNNQYISGLDVFITDCTNNDHSNACKIVDVNDNKLFGEGSVCCQSDRSKCSALSAPKQNSLKGETPAESSWQVQCSADQGFYPDAYLTNMSAISNASAVEYCCSPRTITANRQSDIQGATLTDIYGQYIKLTDTGDTELDAPGSIEFVYDDTTSQYTNDQDSSLQSKYECKVGTGTETLKYAFDKEADGSYTYKISGCEDTDNIFCKVPRSYSGGTIAEDDLQYDPGIYNFSGLLLDATKGNTANYISFNKYSDVMNDGSPSLNPNYGGITCTQPEAGVVTMLPCDKPYDWIKFSGCNNFLDRTDHQFHYRRYSPSDCHSFNSSTECETNNGDICKWINGSCEPLPFPKATGNTTGQTCANELNSEETFSDASWLKEGFQNYNYGDMIQNASERESTRILEFQNTPRQVARRTNFCGYTDESSPLSTSVSSQDYAKPDKGNYYHSRVLDSTWLCENKDCSGRQVNIDIPQDEPNTFVSFFNGDPLSYSWINQGNNSWNGEDFYKDPPSTSVSGTISLLDYRPLQEGDVISQSLDSTNRYTCIGKEDKSIQCGDPIPGPPGSVPTCSNQLCSLEDKQSSSRLMSQDVKHRIDDFTNLQGRYSHIGGTPDNIDNPYSQSEMNYVHNNIKYHNNYATMCGDNMYLKFFDYEEMSTINPDKIEATSNLDAGATNLNKNYQKCAPCRYQRDEISPDTLPYNIIYNNKLQDQVFSDVERDFINYYNYPKPDDDNSVFLNSSATLADPHVISNKTHVSIDSKNKMRNCTVSESNRKDIDVREYSTHFVPWWNPDAASDLKVSASNFKHISSPTSITIPTCDLHMDRCDNFTTSASCLSPNTQSLTSLTGTPPSSISMCNWSGDAGGGTCTTNPSWVNDQTMCGHPCLSRIDARPRECKYSDDCEIRDRYNLTTFESNSKMKFYCDKDGRNPILYGENGLEDKNINDTVTNDNKYCNDGYVLVDIYNKEPHSSHNSFISGSHTIYKCLSCEELNTYYGNSNDPNSDGDSTMLNFFDQYINASTPLPADYHDFPPVSAKVKEQYNNKGVWSPSTSSSTTCEKGQSCTSFLWPESPGGYSTNADPNLLKGSDNVITGANKIMYTQDPVVANQVVKYEMNARGNKWDTCKSIINDQSIKGNDYASIQQVPCGIDYIKSMMRIMGLSTREYVSPPGQPVGDRDPPISFSGYGSHTLTEMGYDFKCDYPPSAGAFQWTASPTTNNAAYPSITVNPGGLIPNNKGIVHKAGYDQRADVAIMCPNRSVYNGEFGATTEIMNKEVSHTDRHYHLTGNYKGKVNYYPMCKPLMGTGKKCTIKGDTSLQCSPGQWSGAYEFGQCGCSYDKTGSNANCDVKDYICVGGREIGDSCTKGRDSECEIHLRNSGGKNVYNVAACDCILGYDCTCSDSYT